MTPKIDKACVMKQKLIQIVCLVGWLVLGTIAARADEESDLIQILQGNAGVVEKCAACQRLRVVGTSKSVSALAPLLLQEGTAQAARYALEPMTSTEAGVAHREAFGKAAGNLKAGLADSLSWRKDDVAIPQLVTALVDPDPVTGAAAAVALGRIGGKAAAEALLGARGKVGTHVLAAVFRGLLACGDHYLAGGDPVSAVSVYSGMLTGDTPDTVRIAAWRGLTQADPAGNPKRFQEALTGKDAALHLAALKLIRELGDPVTWRACAKSWDGLPEESQVAVIDAGASLGEEARPILRLAAASPRLTVRQAAWLAEAKAGDPSLIPALAKAAAGGEAAERQTARETLATLHGPGVKEALLAEVDRVEDAEKVELLVAIGDRGEAQGESLLLKYASSGPEPARLAALESLGKLALSGSVPTLLDLVLKSESPGDVEPVLQALGAICRNEARRDQSASIVLARMTGLTGAPRARLLPVMAELGTPAALQATVAATKESDPAIVKVAVRVLSQWPNGEAAARLLEFAQATSDPTLQVLAFRGAIDGLSQESDPGVRLEKLRQALALAKRPEEKRQALGLIAQIPTSEAMALLLGALGDPALANEAALGVLGIAEKLAKTNPQLASEAAEKVLAHSHNPEFIKRAWAMRGKKPGPFIRGWQACGPFTQAGAATAMALFDVVFPPEKPGESVTWKSLQSGDIADLLSLYPGQLNCAAYLKTTINAPEDADAMLLLGSDDGVKAWLNGTVVHTANVDRGLVADQDVAPVKLKKGANELLLKITQGAGGWAACARVVGSDGSPITGLKTGVEP